MNSFRFRFARWVMARRAIASALFVIATAVFAMGLPKVEIRTIFSDLLPTDDPFVQTFLEHPNFGDPLTVVLMVKRKDGETLYNTETLQKVWDTTRAFHLVPGVNPDTILSITTEKARYADATPYGIDMRPLMGDSVPTDPEELAGFHRRVDRSPVSRTYLVSEDNTATLISAGFYEDQLDYGQVIERVRALAAEATDSKHEIHVVGQPILTGWVYEHQKQTYFIFAITVFLLIGALALYVRNTAGIVVPIIVSIVSGIWGFGLVGWLSAPIEPLLMIVPLLLVARSFSHCVQFSDRYYEILSEIGSKRKASEITMGVMLAPSVLGIITDAMGILFIALAPIPAMQRFALFAGFWALCLIPTGVILISILLSYLPQPKNIKALAGEGEGASAIHQFQRALLSKVGSFVSGRRAVGTGIVVVGLSAVAISIAVQIEIGNPVEGSNLLWEDSEFNNGVRAINNHFPGVNSLEVILESLDDSSEPRSARSAEAYKLSKTIQRIAEQGGGEGGLPARVTRSFSDFMEEGNRLYSGGHPKWLPLDPTDQAVGAAAAAVSFGQNPLNFSQVADFKFQNSTISLFYRDNKQDTVDGALHAAKTAIDTATGGEGKLEGTSVRIGAGLASGTIALQQAMNAVVERYHWLILLMLAGAIFVIAALAYRSMLGALIVLVPVMLSNFYLTAAMQTMGIGLDINSVMVAVLGVGVGIDYGFYLLSRICEEYGAQGHDWEKAITAALRTTGKAIMFTAAIMLLGILPWYFMSDLKFTADMGLLLAVIMVINMVLALVVLPLLIWFLKPSFVAREDLLVGESVDLTEFKQELMPQGA